jgi:arylsulfatase A-like enzyme
MEPSRILPVTRAALAVDSAPPTPALGIRVSAWRALRSAWTWLRPDQGEVRSFALMGLAALLVLASYRTYIALDLLPRATAKDLLWIQVGEFEFWTTWAVSWALVSRAVRSWVDLPVRILYHLVSATLVILGILDLHFFLVTGSRSDLESVLYGLENFSRVWPVVTSEVQPLHFAGLAGVAALALAPLLLRARRVPSPVLGATFVLLGTSIAWIEPRGRTKPAKAVREMQLGLVEMMWLDAMEALGDYTLPPDEADLVPLQIEGVEGAARPNVVLVLLESVGYRRTTLGTPELAITPNLLRLAENGLTAPEAWTVVPHTSKALVATLCGHWPRLSSPVREAFPGGLPGRCLPELLSELGYRSAWFQTARESFEDRLDLAHNFGFGSFRHRDTLQTGRWETNSYFGIDDRAMLQPGIAWSAEQPGRPFFAAYLTLASHHNYKIPKSGKDTDWPGATGRLDQYLDAVNYVDDFLGRLVRGYEAAGLMDNTVFVVMGDHGEGFAEHGRNQHDLVIWEEGLRVPLVLYGPGVLGRTGAIEGPRYQLDVLPTVLELAGARVTQGRLPGTSLLAPVDPGRVLQHHCWRAHQCMASRSGDTKFIDHYRSLEPQVFDLSEDPLEKESIAASLQPADIDRYRKELRDWRARVMGRYDVLEARWKAELSMADDRPAVATWDGAVSLLGCTLQSPGPLIPGDAAWVQCRWRAEEPLTENWEMQVRMKAGKRKLDEEWTPAHGEYPTWEWPVGPAITDTFRIHVPSAVPKGTGDIEVGWTRRGGMDAKLANGDLMLKVATVDLVPKPKWPKSEIDGTEGTTGTTAVQPPR